MSAHSPLDARAILALTANGSPSLLLLRGGLHQV